MKVFTFEIQVSFIKLVINLQFFIPNSLISNSYNLTCLTLDNLDLSFNFMVGDF